MVVAEQGFDQLQWTIVDMWLNKHHYEAAAAAAPAVAAAAAAAVVLDIFVFQYRLKQKWSEVSGSQYSEPQEVGSRSPWP